MAAVAVRLFGMQLEPLNPAGDGDVLAKMLEGLPLLNELPRNAVLGGDPGGLKAGVIVLRADGGALSPIRKGLVKAVEPLSRC